MKKRLPLLFLFVTVFVIVIFLTLKFFFNVKNESVKINNEADLTIVTANALKYYDLTEEGKLILVSSEGMTLPEITITDFSMAEIEERYLVFSSGSTMAYAKGQQIVSIDFETGKVRQNQAEDHYAYTGAGASDKYFYSHQATNENAAIYQFDKFGKEVNSYIFEKSIVGVTQFAGKDGYVYFMGTEQDQSDDKLYVDYLFILDEETLELKENVLIADDSENVQMLTSLLLIEDNLYAPVTMTRSRETYHKSGSNLYMKYNLETKEKSYYELPENYPNLIYSSENEDYLIFIHEPWSLGKNGISVSSLTDASSYFIDVNEILETEDIEDAQILGVNTKGDYLFIMTVKGVLTWDMSSRQLVSKLDEDFSIEAGQGIYLWVNN